MKLLPILASLFLAACLAVAGCVGDQQGSPDGKAVPALPGTEWELTAIAITSVNLVEGTTITLTFDEESLGGTAGCNRYFGGYTLEENRIAIDGIGSTLMYCGEAGVMEQEQLYLSLLGEVASVRMDGDILTLSDADGVPGLIFAKAPEKAPIAAALPGTAWELGTIGSNDGTASSVLSGTTITLVFDEETLSGSAGCNRYFGSFEATGDGIAIGAIGSTKMYCGEAGVMEQEQLYLSLLGEVASVRIDGETLTLSDADGVPSLIFAKVPEKAPIAAALPGTAWELGTIGSNDGTVSSVLSGTTITLVFDEETLSGSAGCNRYFGSFEVTGDGIAIGAIGSTKMYCGEAGVMEQEQLYLSLLGEVASVRIDGETLTLSDADGVATLVFRRMVE